MVFLPVGFCKFQCKWLVNCPRAYCKDFWACPEHFTQHFSAAMLKIIKDKIFGKHLVPVDCSNIKPATVENRSKESYSEIWGLRKVFLMRRKAASYYRSIETEQRYIHMALLIILLFKYYSDSTEVLHYLHININ